MKKVTLIKYIDDKYDFYRLKTDGKEFLLSGTGLGVERCDTILADVNITSARLERYDQQISARLIEIKNVVVEKSFCYDTEKKETLYLHAAQILKILGIADLTQRLSKKADKDEVITILSRITGKEFVLAENPTVGSSLRSVLSALGISTEGSIIENAVDAGILLSTEKSEVYFKEDSGHLQVIGLYKEIIDENSPLYNDELCALCYNLISMNIVRLVEEDESFADKILSTYERTLVFPYYEHFGINVKKKTFTDLDGKEMTGFYVPGATLNHTYINEYTTIDNEWHVFSALLDRHIRKWGRAIPVLYNDRTGETVQLHDRMNVRIFSMLMTKQQMVYFIADESIYSYDIETREKRKVYSQPEGLQLQEVPTVTDDGRYLLFFYGTQLPHIPDRACILDTQTGECRQVLDEYWVHNQFGNQENPFAGHFIINPLDKDIVHFLHGGGGEVEDVMWLLDVRTDEKWEPYKAKKLPNGNFGEGLTHWFWMPDGKRLGFVRIRRDTDPSIGKGGICYIDTQNRQSEVTEMVTKREAIHATPDFEGRLFIYDTYNDEPEKYRYTSDISLLDSTTGEEKLLHRINIIKSHPGHPHPIFSADGTHVLFAFTPDESGVVCVCSEKVR